MSAPTQASGPSAYVTEIPGRFCPTYVVDKRLISTVDTSSTTTALNAFLPRVETVDSTFNTPVTEIDELGTNYHAGAYDDLPDAKLTISAYDIGYDVISLLTGKNAPTSATTTYGFNDLNTAAVDVIRQFADPNGKVFASMFHSNMVIEEFGFSLKSKSVAMETYSLAGFNALKFKGLIQTKAYKIVADDVSTPLSGSTYGFATSSFMGADEAPVALPVPTGSQPSSYWIQNGCYNFVKIERYRAGTGFLTFPEVTSSTPGVGTVHYDVSSKALWVNQADMLAGDVWLLTYCTYATDVIVNGQSYGLIYQTTPDTSDAIAVPTRLTPFTIAGNSIPRGQSLDGKLSLKRDRAEGIGDTAGMWGPASAPEVSVSLEIKTTDFGFNAVLQTGSPLGTDDGGTVAGDFYDPNYATRVQLTSAVALVAQIQDPRNAGAVLKTYTIPTMVLNNENLTAGNKNPVSQKYTGSDRTGNLTVSITR